MRTAHLHKGPFLQTAFVVLRQLIPKTQVKESMRDPKRIERILNLLRAYWSQNPDLRLGQLITNFAHTDAIFYTEDALFEAELRKSVDVLTQIAADARSNEVERL